MRERIHRNDDRRDQLKEEDNNYVTAKDCRVFKMQDEKRQSKMHSEEGPTMASYGNLAEKMFAKEKMVIAMYSPSTGKTMIAPENAEQGLNKIQRFPGNSQKVQEGAFGQTTNSATRSLICDLSSPVKQGSTGRMEVFQTGAEVSRLGAAEAYEWRIFSVDQDKYVSSKKSQSPIRNIYYGTPGNYRTEVNIFIDGRMFSSLKLEQTVEAEDSFLTSSVAGSPDAKAYRELVNDFNTYIIDAANSTGVNGITPRMLASVLKIEISNRPKEGRLEEIENVKENYTELKSGGWIFGEQKRTDRSIGVGQIRTSTASMLLGKTKWIDQDVNDKDESRDQIKENFGNVKVEERWDIFEQLRFPKSNILMAANLLSKLKNRPNRFPNLSKTDFAANKHAVEVVATEYNMGGTNSNAEDAQSSGYGATAWSNLNSDNIIIHYFPNT